MFRWTDFLTFAKSLAASNDEAALRSAISRAYYAAFHAAREVCRDHGLSMPQETAFGSATEISDHVRVINALKEHRSRRLRSAGKLLHSLRTWRNAADYKVPFGGDVKGAAKRAVLCAEGVIAALDAFRRNV